MKETKMSFYFRIAVIALIVVILSGYFWCLAYDATVNNAIDQSESNRVNLITTTETVSAARGEITDRYGNVLVTNKTEYVVTLDVEAMGDEADQVAVVQRLIEICTEQGIEWTDSEFPVSEDNGSYEFTTENPYQVTYDDGTTATTRLGQVVEEEGWGTTSTSASRLVSNMKKFFQLDDTDLTETEVRQILGVLYSCYLRKDEIVWTYYYFAEDVDIDFISVVKEEDLAGVNIEATTVRQYNTDYAAVLLGQTGSISAEMWETLQDEGYDMDDTIGLSGIEAAFEEYLQGTDGTLLKTYDSSGNLVSEEYTEEPAAGYNTTTTLDIGLQAAVEEALAELTDEINDGAGGSAAVVIDVNSGEVLAMASYPTYSAATYLEDYNDLLEDERNPLYNRALLGTYAPGSTYKICTAVAIANYGIASPSNTVSCTGSLTYGDTTFRCWNRSGHGTENMQDAVRDSCNVYFYTYGAALGIDAQTEMAQAYGLGVSTGIELSESTGVNAGPAYSESLGATWYAGDVLSAAIGQSDNQFTPLQLANYIATFANGGTHYYAHLLKNVKSSDNSTIICEYADVVEDPVMNEVTISDATYEAITAGMGEVIAADDITDFDALYEQGIEVACKTGTAQLGSTGLYNGLFVSFAPIDDPQIAICTVVEKASSGASTAAITAAIMEYYFSEEATLERIEAENSLLH